MLKRGVNVKTELDIIGYIKTPFNDKFGVPRQSCMVDDVVSYIEMLPKYSDVNAFRGLDSFSHIWVIWGFSERKKSIWSPTVRPPRLGGNKRMGVFSTRSPVRPNPLGLSSLKLLNIENKSSRTILKVAGADMVNGTPVFDIKPYIPFTDSHPDASSGFADTYKEYSLEVEIPEQIENKIDKERLITIKRILSLDPRPGYQQDCNRVYGVSLYNYNVKFSVKDEILTVIDISQQSSE